jgi:hypothetical protein
MGHYNEVLQRILNITYELANLLLSDFSDNDLLVRPVPKANRIAWELGHWIIREYRLIGSQNLGMNFPQLPVGFEQQHSDATAGQEPPVGFFSKTEYTDILAAIHQATTAALARLSDTDLDAPVSGEARVWWLTLGELFAQAIYMRGAQLGQLTIARRQLGKPVLF